MKFGELNITDLASTEIRKRIQSAGASYNANDNISSFIREGELDALKAEVELHMLRVLDSLVIDRDDPNSHDTAKRVAKMFVNETFAGRYTPQPVLTEFPNTKNLDELYTVGPISINSTCSHHLVPITGSVWVGVFPGEKLIGLSKFHRLVRWILRRGHIQEDATVMIADHLEEIIKPKGVAVVFKARHLCCSCRGVEDPNTLMTTSVVRGAFRDTPTLKAEFFNLISSSLQV